MPALTRRQLLTAAAIAPFIGTLPRAFARSAPAPRILVLVELNGGNDGLNTVIPYADAHYAAARPTLAIARDRVLQLDERLGLHPALAPLMPLWQAKNLGVALGVGYKPTNRSHFRSIEIWNSASTAEETLQDGWLHRVLTETGIDGTAQSAIEDPAFDAQGIVLGGPEGPLAGSALAPVVMRDPRQLGQAVRLLDGQETPTGNPALAHILTTRARMHGAALDVARRLKEAPPITTTFPKSALGRQFELAADLIAAGVPASFFKLQHSGYDTHAQQAPRHAALLGDLAEALVTFRQAMIEVGAWDRVLVVTYAEFGRRAAENASGGSDHGTAAPHFLLGGRLGGGFYGEQPRLDDLEGGDLTPRLDFRRLYAAVAQGWLGLPPAPGSLGRHAPLPLFG
ncbi:DUF1501 domain-containing protein [Pelagibius sp. 7325]|uniref:DUF1501 domain-containing protein n=1 Tax=Pelagibius sp. 7325 TaxID=3131994 RepID=UPI0030EF946E